MTGAATEAAIEAATVDVAEPTAEGMGAARTVEEAPAEVEALVEEQVLAVERVSAAKQVSAAGQARVAATMVVDAAVTQGIIAPEKIDLTRQAWPPGVLPVQTDEVFRSLLVAGTNKISVS